MDRMSGLLVFLSMAFLPSCLSDSKQPQQTKKVGQSNSAVTSAVLPVYGNVYPLGYYYTSVKIGNPGRVFELDIDTGSDLTWVQCDAPCTGCTKPRDKLYKPNNNLLHCVDPICTAVQSPVNHPCANPTDQCDYEIAYADHGSSLGVLVTDKFPIKFTNGSTLGPLLAFGCGYDQTYGGVGPPPPTAGVLGLGIGKASILSQLTKLGLTRNVSGHCLGSRGGYFFFGDDFVPSSGMSWTQISHNSLERHYSSGPADIHFAGKPSEVKGLDVIFDSGSSYSYFNSKVYETVLNMVKKGLNGKALKDAAKEPALPICWKGNKAFKSVQDAKSLFPSFSLSFTKAKNVMLELPPEAYLVVTERGNACLGILNGTEVGLANHNIIGDISLQGKMVIYDNEHNRIGWSQANCDRLPNMDKDYLGDFSSQTWSFFGVASPKASQGTQGEL